MEAGTRWTGCLFQHGRMFVGKRGYRTTISEDGTREEVKITPPGELQKVVKAENWNEYEVVAKGSQIKLSINGTLMCEVDDKDKGARRKEIIGLHMHRGRSMKVQFKDVRIKILK